MGGGSQPAQTTQVSKVELPAWVDAASQENYGYAKDVANRPLEQYEGQRVADTSPYTQQANQLAVSNVGSTDPYFKSSADIYNRTAGPLDINKYLNPYTEEVQNRSVDAAQRSLQGNLLANTDQAQKAKAFGGSRFGIQNAVTQAESTRGIGDLVAQLRQKGFDTATATALADRTGMQSSAAGLLNVASGQKAAQGQDVATLFGAGQADQAQNQAVIDSLMAKFNERRDYPIQQLNTRLAALGMSPYGKTETSSKTGTSEKPGTDWATVGLGALKTLPALFAMSDRNMKTDIEKITDGPVPLYAYRYKSDPKTYPKVVGPMVQDVEKKFPSSVKKFGGKRVIDINNLMEALR